MSQYQTMGVVYGEWAPDTPKDILEQGVAPLATAKNVYWHAGAYRLYKPFLSGSGTLAAVPTDAITEDNSGTLTTFAGTSTALYTIIGGTVTDVSKAGGYTAGSTWNFERFGDCLIATNGVDAVQDFDLGVSTAFADLAGTPPKGYVVGKVRDFVVLGNITDAGISYPYRVQWGAIANPTSWPTPLTQAARDAQSGYQDLYSDYGEVKMIAQGEEMGIIFQQRGIVRMRYIGGDVVFEFYTFERKRGLVARQAAAQIGNMIYFLSSDGFYATDGNQVQPIGLGKVNDWFISECYDITQARAAVDTQKHTVQWSFPSTSSGVHDRIIIYNFAEGRWSYAEDTTVAMFQSLNSSGEHIPQAFSTINVLGDFSGTQSSALMETDLFRLSGNRSTLVGVKSISDGIGTYQVAATDTDDAAQTFSTAVTRNSRSYVHPFRQNGFLHAVRYNPASSMTYAQGIQVTFCERGKM